MPKVAYNGHDDGRRRRNAPTPLSGTFSGSGPCQDETGGFTAFIPWTFQKENTPLGERDLPEVTATESFGFLHCAGSISTTLTTSRFPG